MNFLYVKIPLVNPVPNQSHQLDDKVDQILKETGMG
jgi:hypothetical protein